MALKRVAKFSCRTCCNRNITSQLRQWLSEATFNPARPLPCCIKKTADGYELVGAMYTMPKRAQEEQLNERAAERGYLAPAHEFVHAGARQRKLLITKLG